MTHYITKQPQIRLFKFFHLVIIFVLFPFVLLFFFGGPMKFAATLNLFAFFLSFANNSNGNPRKHVAVSEPSLATETLLEESGRCTIIIQQRHDTPILQTHSLILPRLCTLGRIELSWVVKQGQAPKAKIVHLEVDREARGQGVGSNLFQTGIKFFMSYLEAPEISWKAQSLDPAIPLTDLIRFYEKQGGFVTKLFEALRIACMELKPDFIEELRGDRENFYRLDNSSPFGLVDTSMQYLSKISSLTIIKKYICEGQLKTHIISDKNASGPLRQY